MEQVNKCKFSWENFINPPNKFRGAPFWAWNSKLDKEELLRQIGYFQEMGMGGFHIHSRTGLATEYLGIEYLENMKACIEAAKEKDMYVHLYDEDRWPSGFGGGRVTKDPAYKSTYLVFTHVRDEDCITDAGTFGSTMKTRRAGNGKLLECYEVKLENGYLKSYSRCSDCNKTGYNIWYLYLEIAESSPWYNNESYVDTLNPKAIEKFIEVTHDKYKEFFGDEFGRTIPAIFTDEPQLPHKTALAFPDDKGDVILPYTEKFPEFYYSMYREDFFNTIPEIIFETQGDWGITARYRYHNAVAELFSISYADTIGQWCKKNNILLTGHMMAEESLEGQTKALGEVMRTYRSFGIPGIDMLCDRREYSTAKQAESAAHQFGCVGVISEMYGATDWDFDFRGHKLAGDWQACLGVTLRVPHLAWYSMKGEAKRDLPASIFYQSPWYKEYRILEDYFARINTVMTCGRPRVRIGLLHPIETYWLYYGPVSQTWDKREELEARFKEVVEWLLFAQLDFDFIAESLLDELYQDTDNKLFRVGEMEYDVVVVPCMDTIRSSTVEKLEKYAGRKGDLLIMGNPPEYVDGIKSKAGKALADNCNKIEFSRQSLISYLDKYRDIEIREDDGRRADCFIYQLREEIPYRYLFIANGRKIDGWSPFPGETAKWYNEEIPTPKDITLRIVGGWEAEYMDPMSGKIFHCSAEQKDGDTYLSFRLYVHDSILLRLRAATGGNRKTEQRTGMRMSFGESKTIKGPVRFILEEENVLMLDQASFCLDNGPWEEQEELLRIDNILRTRLDYPLKTEAFAQPWIKSSKTKDMHRLALRFEIMSDVDIPDLRLAVEDAMDKAIILNGRPVTMELGDCYADHEIPTVRLPGINKGRNCLEIHMPYGDEVNIEWCYLLGSFGVSVQGDRARITSFPSEIMFGDYTVQGFPFYGGNFTYEVEMVAEAGQYEIYVSHFSGALVGVSVDGKDRGRIMLSPYKINIGELTPGLHKLSFKVFGNRRNTFGAVHNSDKKERWYGPDAWRTTGEKWSYEYCIRPMGILQAPRLIKISDD